MRPALALVAVSLLFATRAEAHGGLPVAQSIIFQGDTLVVPTHFWGVFLGKDGGEWRWICEEAINADQSRVWALALDGTYYVTDYSGLTISRDGGCTWLEATGPIAAFQTTQVVADPVDGKRAWVTTSSGPQQAPVNGLYTTDDDGVTWSAALTGDEYFQGVALSPDGQRIYTIGIPRSISYTSLPDAGDDGGGAGDGGAASTPVTQLHVSSDGGKSWTSVPFPYLYEGFAPFVVVPVAVDPRDLDTVYLRVETDPTDVLLKVTKTGVTTEVLSKDTGYASDMVTVQKPGIGRLEFDVDKDEMFISASDGLYVAQGTGAPKVLPALSESQCVEKHGSSLYACSWNYAPDCAAIARSDDDGQSFVKVFQYADTCGPVTTCGADTQVGKMCQLIWTTYGDQLGANFGACHAPVEAAIGACSVPSADGGACTNCAPKAGCNCALGSHGDHGSSRDRAWLLLCALVGVTTWRRRRAA